MMLSYAHGAYDEPLLGETIGHNLERTASRVPDVPALVSCHQGRAYTYGEFDAAVNRLAAGLLAAGIDTGDRVGVWAPNRAEWTLVQRARADTERGHRSEARDDNLTRLWGHAAPGSPGA